MSEAGRVSVAVEVTGLDKATSDLGKLDTAGAKASASVGRSMAALEKQMAAIDAIVTKATSGIVAAIDRQSAAMTKGFSGIDAAMRRMQTGTAAAAASVSADAGKAGASLTQLDAIADRVAAGVTAALAGIAPAAASAATGTQQATTAMAGFDAAAQTIVAASARMEAALQEATGATRALSDSFAKAPKSDPFKPQSDGAENLRAKFNPLFAIGETYRTQVAAIRQANADGAIGFHEMEMAIQRAGAVADAQQRQYVKMDAALGATGDAARLTSNQMLNLSRQGNDVITMFAMGAPPMQIFASQAGQIYGALEEGPRGLRGSLEAIKGAVMGFAAGLGPAGIALGALGAAAVTFGIATRRNVEPIEDVIKRQSDAVRQLRDAYGLAGDAAESYVRRSPRAVRLGLADDNAATIQRAQDEIRARLSEQYSGGSEGRRYRDFRTPAYRELVLAFEALRKSAADGAPDFRRFEDALASIPEIDLAGHAGEVIAQNRAWAAGLIPLQSQIAEMNGLLNGAVAATERYNAALDDINERIPDLRTNAEQINAALSTALSNAGDDQSAGLIARWRAEKAMAADTAGALDIYTQARAELAAVGLGDDARAIAQINAQYDALEDQYLGNADALNVLVGARRAAIEAVNAQSAFDAGEKARKDAEEYTQALADQARGIDEQVAGLQRQVQTFGQSEGAIRANEERARMLAAAYQLASENNSVVTPAQIAQIDQAAAAIGGLTDQLIAMREAQAQAERVAETIADLEFQGSLFGLSEVDREIATTLNGLKLTYQSMDGQRIAGAIRYNAALEETQDQLERQRELVENVASTFLDIFTDNSSDIFFDRILSGLADVSRQFGELGKQRLMENMFGGSYTIGQPAPGQRSVAAPGFSAGVASNDNSPVGLNVRAVSALNDNLRQSSRSALDVAKQFDGLNERADSRVLDSFMQASGTWRNLSASDTAWCAAFANAAIVKAGGQGTNSNLASSFMDWGMGTNNPKPGDIVVLKPQARGASGHVTFFDGFDANGNVRGFGGNQSNSARTSTYSADQVRAFRTATRDGYVDAARQIATGQSGNVPSSVAIPSARPVASLGAVASSGGLFGQGGRVQQFMQSPLGMGGMNALSAFGAGASSGSPVSGGFSGALGAFGMGLGPVGIIAGGLAGIVGGLFGRSRQRREQRRQQQEQERQQRLQAQQQLDQQLPAILELQDTLLDRASGTLTKERARIESQIKQYQTLAATAKNQAEIDRLKSMQANLDDYMNRLYDQIRLTADSVVQSMMAGRGLEPEFAKAVSAVREQSLSIRNYLADLTAATGSGSAAVVQATEAGRTQLLRQLSGAEEVTEIWTGLDRLSGTAAQLGTELQKLGMNAEEAAAAVRDHLNRGIQRMRDDFVRGIADETAEGMGLGYLPQLRALTDRRNTMRADATSLGADPALIDRWFGVQARNILDQAGLLNEEIAPLVKAFPELAGVLGDSSAKIERTLGDAENDLRTAYQRVRQFADQLASFRGDIALDRNLSILGPQERLLEAQNRFRAASEKAAAGDAVAQGELIGLSRSYLDEARSYYASSEGYFSIFREVDGTLKATEAKVVAELDMATAQHKALLDLNASVLTIPDALRQLNEAMAVRDLAQGQALQAYVQALNPQAAIPSYQQPTVAVTPTAPAPVATAPAPTAPAMVNRSLWNGQTYSNYVGNFQEFNGRSIFVPSGWTAARAWSLHVQQQQAPRGGANGPTYNAGMRLGGVVGGYQGGGVVGNGIWDVDSVLARYEGGGMIALAKGEGVLNAPAMRRPGVRPFMEAANAGRLPSLPQIAMPSLPRVTGADNRELVVELQALRREVQALKAVTAQGAMETAGAVREGNASAREQTMALKRSNAA